MFEVRMNVTNPNALDAFVISNRERTVSGTTAEVKELYKVLKNLFEEEDCGCGGCEDALAECMEEDELPYVTPEELFDFIKSVYALIEVERGGDEV